MKKGSLIYKSRGFVYFHFCLYLIVFYFIFHDIKSDMVWFLSGLFMIILGESIRLWSASYIGTIGKAFNLNVKNFRTSGPYSHVRNPIYLGNFIWITGLAVISKMWFLIPYFVIFLILLYSKIIPREEKYLDETFGDVYKKYCKYVNRIIPKFHKYQYAEHGSYSLLAGLKNELHVIIYEIIVVIVVFTVSYIRNGYKLF